MLSVLNAGQTRRIIRLFRVLRTEFGVSRGWLQEVLCVYCCVGFTFVGRLRCLVVRRHVMRNGRNIGLFGTCCMHPALCIKLLLTFSLFGMKQ